MTRSRFLNVHRAWEDWLAMALGLATALAPWVTAETSNQAAVINAAIAGLALMMLGELDLVHARRWVILGQLVCGLWIAVSAPVLGYGGSGTLRVWHTLLGCSVLALGSLELWQLYRSAPAGGRSDGSRGEAGDEN